MRLVIIEDHLRFGQTIAQGLQEAGHDAVLHTSGANGLAACIQADVDVVLLDLGLPDIDGMEVLTQLRRQRPGAPVIVLTARDAVESRVAALDAGADDYLVKPFAFAELLARVLSLHRRATAPRWTAALTEDIVLHDDFSVVVRGQTIALLRRQFALLSYLLSRKGEVVSRADILRNVLGYDFDPGTNVVDVHLTHLRRRLAATHIKIETIRGAGLRLDMATSEQMDNE
jgi:DNA-binding response OmpR family regulator